MHIANPIYDAVFKYLLDDNRVARLFISAIIGEEIEALDFAPTEIKTKKKQNKNTYQPIYTVYRVDFSARIRTAIGTKQVLIEIQKAKLPTDIMRFRRYLGENFADEKNIIETNGEKHALPIITIYFLGYPLNHINVPVLKVNRQYIDLATGDEIHVREEFIESLTHDSYVIQVSTLKNHRRTELEQVLAIFDQDNQTNDRHILNFKEENLPEKYRIIFRRLLEAASNTEVRKYMKVEDDIIESYKLQERKLAIAEKRAEAAEKQKEVAEKQKEAAEKQKEAAEKQKEEAYNRIKKSIQRRFDKGDSINDIADDFEMSIQDIEKMVNK